MPVMVFENTGRVFNMKLDFTNANMSHVGYPERMPGSGAPFRVHPTWLDSIKLGGSNWRCECSGIGWVHQTDCMFQNYCPIGFEQNSVEILSGRFTTHCWKIWTMFRRLIIFLKQWNSSFVRICGTKNHWFHLLVSINLLGVVEFFPWFTNFFIEWFTVF